MNTPEEVIRVATEQIGYSESGTNQVRFWPEIGRPDLQGNPWCAAFVTWCMKQAGVPFPTIDTPGGYVYCPDAVTYGRAHGELVSTPKKGDIILFDWEHDSISDHTGIITGVVGTTLYTVEGNVDNRVEVMTRSFNDAIAFFRPPYGSSTPSGPIPLTISVDATVLRFLVRRHAMLDSVPGGGIIVARPDGAVDCYDGARNFGSMFGKKMNAPVVGIASTPSGLGYWLLGEDGGVFNFGDAQWKGPRLEYYKKWGIGLGTQSPLVGIRRGEGDKEYVIVADNPTDTQARLYYINKDGQYTR
jgi:CHAP domain